MKTCGPFNAYNASEKLVVLQDIGYIDLEKSCVKISNR